MKKAKAIVTNRGGRTCHAAIVSRELGLPAIVGTQHATHVLADGHPVTVSCAEGETGFVYDGQLEFTVETVRLSDIARPRTKIMLNVAKPDEAFALSMLPNDGVGLARIEFIIANSIAVHPLALLEYAKITDAAIKARIDELTAGYDDKPQFFIDRLAEGVAMIAAAFYPKDVIVRLSDFKTNEYANLLGGRPYEPVEENPMIGFRGASRYYDPRFREAFALECRALGKVRRDMGLSNVKIMIPFCRTVEEGRRVLEIMARHGLVRGQDGLEVYVMCEIPSNVVCAAEFAEIFDGFSIGSNDLTQLALGVDRDSEIVAHVFDERDPAVKRLIAAVISAAHQAGRKIGICGQAPSDYPRVRRLPGARRDRQHLPERRRALEDDHSNPGAGEIAPHGPPAAPLGRRSRSTNARQGRAERLVERQVTREPATHDDRRNAPRLDAPDHRRLLTERHFAKRLGRC
jgi:pyruvate,water dikinase